MADEQSKADGEEQVAAGQPVRKRRRRWPYVLGVCAVVLILLIALLPRILSLGAARRLILSRVNSRLDGSVEMASWSLRWFSGLGFEGVKLKDADGRTVLEVEAVHVSASVPMLLGSVKDLGTVDIVSPSFDLVRGEPGAGVPSPGEPPGPRPSVQEPPALRVPLPFDLKARLLVRDGSGSVRFADAGPLDVRDVKADVTIDGLQQPIHYEAEAAAGEGGGRLKLTGSATVAKDGVVSLDHLEASSEASVSGFDLSDVSPIAKGLGLPVDVAGLVDGRLTAEVKGTGAAASGEVHVRNLVLAGGPLGTDRPEIGKVDASFDLEVSADGGTVRELQIVSPVGRAELSGTLSVHPEGALPRGSLKAGGSVDLAPLAKLLPNTLRLREGLVIEGGTCALQAQVDSDGETARLTGDFRLAELVAATDGREIRPQAPLAARLVAEIGPAGPRVELIELDSSFATAKATGTLDQFALDASVDLAAAMAEAARFVDVGQWQMSGALEAHLAIGPGEAARPAELLIEGALTARDLRVARAEAVLLSEDAMSATASVLVTLDERRILRQLADLRADVRGSFGEASMSISQIANMDALDALVVSDMEVTGTADLGRLSALVRSFGLAPPGIDAQGSATVALAGALGEGTFQLTGLNAEAKGLSVTSGGRVVFASDVKAEGAGQADIAARRLRVSRAALDAAVVQAGVTDLVVADWSRVPAGVTGRFSGSLDLAGLPALMGRFIDAFEGMQIAGTAQLEAEISAAGEADDDLVRAVRAKAVLADVAVQGLTERPIREESATFAFSGLIGPHAGESGWVLSNGAGSARSSLFSSELKLPRAIFGGPGQLEVSGMEVTGTADLGRLSALVRSFGLAPPGIDAQGSATVVLAGALGEGIFQLTHLNAEAKGLNVTSGGRVLFASDVKAEGAGQADLSARRLRVSRAALDVDAVQAAVTGLVVADWSRVPAGVTGRFSGSVDLAGLPALLGRSVDASTGMQIAGTAQLEADISAAGEADDVVRAVSAKAVLTDVAVEGLTERPIREGSATFAFSGLIGPHAGESGWVLSDGAGSARSSLLSSELELARVVFGGPGQLEVSGMALTAECELGPLADLAGRLGLLPDGLEVTGSAEVAGAAAFEQRRLDLKGIEGVVRDLALAREGKAIREPEVRMAAELHVDLPGRSVACPGASLKLSSGTIAAKDVTVADWGDLTRDVAGNISASLDVAGLLETVADYVPLPQDMSPAGKLDLKATVARREGGWDANLRAASHDLKIARPNAPDIALGDVELLAQGTAAPAGPTVTFDPIRLSSDFLGVEGRLALGGAPPERRLEAGGSLEVDFNRIGSLLSEMTGWDVELRGRQSRPFHVVADLSGEDWRQALRSVQAEAGVALERFAFGGVQAESVAAESDAGEGRVAVEVTGTVNEGELRLPLALDLTGRPPALAVPPGSQILANVKLTDQMANVILARAAPVFMGALTIQGTTGVDCQSFRVPLERGLLQTGAVTAGLSFQEVSFGSAGVLNSVLSLVNLGDRVARLPDQRVEVALQGGRMHQGRLELYVDKYLLLASGSVGLDKSLDYLIEVPITEELIGSGDTYDLLRGQTLKVRVTGSLGAPKIDRDTIRENVQSLIREAAGRMLFKRGLEGLFD